MKIFTVLISALVLTVSIYSQNLLNGPDDIVFDAKYNRYLIGNWAGNRIVAVDSNGNQTLFKTGLLYCHGLELFGDTLYAASADKIYGIDINNSQIIKNITVTGSSRLGHITLDTLNNILYVSDWNAVRIFKVDINSNSSSVLVGSGIGIPGGVMFDRGNNRIILLIFEANTPIKAVNPTSGQVTNITTAGYNELDAITKDRYGFIYVTSFTQGVVYRFDSTFSAPPEIISTGHNGPSGLGYNSRNHILGVTNYNSSSYSLITLPLISVKNISVTVENFVLFQNYPNPFNPSTKIKFSLPFPSEGGAIDVKLAVYDVMGREVETLFSSPLGRTGGAVYEVEWNASGYSSGIYFYKLTAGKYVYTKKMCLLK